jgi:multimeric flavodoxin WrbA
MKGEIQMSTEVKVLGISFSPRHGNTEVQIRETLKAAEELDGVTTEFYNIVGRKLEPCDSCYRCFQKANVEHPCPAYDDPDDCFDEIVKLIFDADGIVFGSPVYFMDTTAQMRAFMDRSMGVEVLGYPWRNKVAGFVTSGFDRNGGQEHAIRSMQNWAMMHDMMIVGVGPERPTKGIGGYIGAMGTQGFPLPVSNSKPEGPTAVRQDEIGMYAAKCVGWRVAEMAKVIKAGFEEVEGETRWPSGSISLGIVGEWEEK